MRLLVIEFKDNDPRPLGTSGDFLSGQFAESDVATFASEFAAKQAVGMATNRREGSIVDTVAQGSRRAA